MAENTYLFDLPTHHKSIIKVIGVGVAEVMLLITCLTKELKMLNL